MKQDMVTVIVRKSGGSYSVGQIIEVSTTEMHTGKFDFNNKKAPRNYVQFSQFLGTKTGCVV